MKNLEEINLKLIMEEYENVKSLKETAKNLKIPIRIIKIQLLENGGEKGKKILLQDLKQRIPQINEIIEEYQQGELIKEISEKFEGLSEEKISFAIKQYEIITGEKNTKSHVRNYRDDIKTDEIVEQYRNGIKLVDIANSQKASVTAIRNRINKYVEDNEKEEYYKILEEREKAIEIQKRREKADKIKEEAKKRKEKAKIKSRVESKVERQEQKEDNLINLFIIVKYFKLGYSLNKILKFARERGYKISESDIETARKIEDGEQKLASEKSIIKIIEKYGYSYNELAKIGEEKGYIVLEGIYESAQNNIKLKNKQNREKEGEEK